MKYLSFVVALAALILGGCQKDMTTDAPLNHGTTTLSVSLEQSRTSLGEKNEDEYPTFWSEGDCIAVNGVKSEEVNIDPQNKAHATFSFNGVLEFPYLITYPHTAATTAATPKVTFLAEQSYTKGTFANGSAPMCGYAADSKSNIALKHLAGVLRFAIRSEEGVQTILKSVSIHSAKALAGDFEVDCQSDAITPTANCSKSIKFTLPSNFTLSSSKDEYLFIAVPYGTLGLCEFIFTDAKGKKFRAQWNGSAVKAGIVREFKSITFRETEEPVQLEDMTETVVDEWDDKEVTVKGYIRSNGKPIANVVVSDGLLCTKTNANGFYALKSNLADTKFVMVSIPSGYTAPTDANGLPIFYHRVTNNEKSKNLCVADFSFNKIANNSDRFTLLVGADPQPRASSAGYDNNAYHSLDCCNDLYRDMREKAAAITDQNVYGLMLGDIVHENMGLYDNYIEGLKTLGLRCAKDLFGCAVLGKKSVIKEDNAVCNLARKAHLVCYNYHSHSLACKLLHNVKNLSDHFGVKCACGLVKEHYLGLHAKCAYYCNSLLLTARKLVRIGLRSIGKSYSRKKCKCLCLCLFLGYLLKHHGSECEVFKYSQMREKIELLEHHSHLLSVKIKVNLCICKLCTVENYASARGLLQKV